LAEGIGLDPNPAYARRTA